MNRDKNRFKLPTADDIDSEESLASVLAPGEDRNRFDQSGPRIVGFVVDVTIGGRETCNCGATNPIDRDTHSFAMASWFEVGGPRLGNCWCDVETESRVLLTHV